MGSAANLTVSARGLCAACGLSFAPAILALVLVAMLQQASGLTGPSLTLLVAGALALALAASGRLLRRHVESLLQVSLEVGGDGAALTERAP